MRSFDEFTKDKNKAGGIASTCKHCLYANKKTEESKANRRATRPRINHTRVCIWSGKPFTLPAGRGQRDRVMSLESEAEQVKLFGRKLSMIAGTMVSHAKTRSEKFGLPFNLTVEYIYSIIPKDAMCPVLNVPMRVNSRHTLSLDKVIPSKGYVEGNVEIISLKANQMKSDATPAEILQLANYIQRKQNV
jgi:hypothetical protein